VNEYPSDLWRRACTALETAHGIAASDPDGAASRAYYAAFHAASALFALEGQEFRRHSTIEAAVHRDLVKAGRWAEALGKDYRSLRRLRATGDYGGLEHVTAEDAQEAIKKARRILDAVRQACPQLGGIAPSSQNPAE